MDIINLMNDIIAEIKNEPQESINSRVLIIDGLNNFIRNWVAYPLTNDDGDHMGGCVGFLQSMGSAISVINPTRIIIAFDGKGGSKYRKSLYPEYKANRNAPPKTNRKYEFQKDEDASKSMAFEMQKLLQYLKVLPVTIMMHDNIEADDIIGYVAHEFFNDTNNKLYIMSTDRDFYQLINKSVSIYNPIKKCIIDEKLFSTEFNNINKNNFILLKSLLGDDGDNIPGLKGLGVKTILKNFNILSSNENLTCETLIEWTKNLEKKSKAHNTLLENYEQFLLNYKLIKLDSKFINQNTRMHILTLWNNKPPTLQKISLINLLIKDKVVNNFKNIHVWISEKFSYLDSFKNLNK
ncbi:MAG TPA: hypothetical protein PLY35_10375 [Thermotogota bacterium]|nr:hypothetical protein [Thermotogota bacterium]